MKQGLFILLALIPIISAFDEAYAYQQCPQDYIKRMQEFYGCASQEQVQTEPCFQQCVDRIWKQKFIKLYNCWQLICKSTIITLPCNVELCVKNFEVKCLEKNNLKSIECMIEFSQQHPECKCFNQ
ncbi:unnamed protein product [Paramecium primaurelia]|uniref:Transmembrane protein n=1 Tax=Paramecium primaurelia TaxID=5886 RepID=A0A8S1NQC4_PARPR|nr:unnamed protein product [Paramecium primaurelia]